MWIPYLEQDTDAQIHKRLGEVDDGLAGIVDRHRGNRQIRSLCDKYENKVTIELRLTVRPNLIEWIENLFKSVLQYCSVIFVKISQGMLFDIFRIKKKRIYEAIINGKYRYFDCININVSLIITCLVFDQQKSRCEMLCFSASPESDLDWRWKVYIFW